MPVQLIDPPTCARLRPVGRSADQSEEQEGPYSIQKRREEQTDRELDETERKKERKHPCMRLQEDNNLTTRQEGRKEERMK